MRTGRQRLRRLFSRIGPSRTGIFRRSRSTYAALLSCERRSMPVIQTIIQFPAAQCIEECCVILEWTSNSAPNYFWFRISLRKFGNQDVKRVSDSAALVMDDVIIAAYRCPNKALTRESRIRDRVSRVPILARFCNLAIVAGTKCDNGGWKIAR